MHLFQVIVRTLFFYFFICLTYRLMGKREIGQLGVIDLIVSILIAELVAISIEKTNQSMFMTIVPIAILVVLEIALAYLSCKSKRLRKFFNGKQSIIIINGKINFKEMIKQRYSLDDLLFQLRQNNIKSLEEVEYAILETNGKLSIFKYNMFKIKSAYPLPLVIDGKIQFETLRQINKTETWLMDSFHELKVFVEDIFYAFYKNKKMFIIKHSDLL